MKNFHTLNIYQKLKNIDIDNYAEYKDIWIIPAWSSAWSPRKYDVEGEISIAKPFYGNKDIVANTWYPQNPSELIMMGKIALIERGSSLTLADKVRYAVRLGALGVIIIDDTTTRCGTYFQPMFTQRCVQGSDKTKNTGFAYLDDPSLWTEGSRIPAVLIPRDAGLALRKLVSST